ncbi:MAG: hypothetical protein FJ096_16785 [Deltaproteobacteria bacterium]|nr:hypothetical protein [Deltaproteobacteria bacterium]
MPMGGCTGISAGVDYPDYSRSEVKDASVTPENEDRPGIDLQTFRIRDEVCKDLDTSVVTRPLAADDLTRFLRSVGASNVEIRARGNLYWFDFPGDDPEAGDVVRLRVAVLNDSKEAANELHKSLLEHGPGWWGLRRSNLSILAPRAGVAESMAFALRYKLPCWGMFEMADADDVMVIPGPYMEL